MPDVRRHRGPHPGDEALFAPEHWGRLRSATSDLCWLLTRGYAVVSANKLVGDRFALRERQRTAVQRSSCSDAARRARSDRRRTLDECVGGHLWIDGFNVLTTIEAALADGVLLLGRDGCLRDMASMHGSYRKVAETVPALRLIGETLASAGGVACRWYLDRPVSNSGRLGAVIREVAVDSGWDWDVELADDPDVILCDAPEVVVSADSVILDRAEAHLNLARLVVESSMPQRQVVDLSLDRDAAAAEGP